MNTRQSQTGIATIKLVIAGVVIIIILAIVFSARPRRIIGVSVPSITVPAGGQTTFSATLLAKGWGWGTPGPVAGTVSHMSGNIVQITPVTGTTTATAPNQILTVVGAAPGNGTISVRGSSAGGTHDANDVTVKVTGG